MKMNIMGFFMHGELFMQFFVYPTKNPLTRRIGLSEYGNFVARPRLCAHTNQLILERNSSKVSNLGRICEQHLVSTIIEANCCGLNFIE